MSQLRTSNLITSGKTKKVTLRFSNNFQIVKFCCRKREVEILRDLRQDVHPNIIKILEHHNTKKGKHRIYFELMDGNLYEAIHREWNLNHGLGIYEHLYVYQLFRGLGFLESLHPKIIHRDIKPENLLVKHSHGILKIADFGSAIKRNEMKFEYSYVCSRWYRAPELICAGLSYITMSTAIDHWSAGVVMYEVITGSPLFPSELKNW